VPGGPCPGRWYSESIGLSHEDERTYDGEILEDLSVAGSVTFGTDLGTDARPEPVGKFLLTRLSMEFLESGSLEIDDEDEGEGAFQ